MAGTQTPRGDASVLANYRSAINSAAAKYHVDPVIIGGIIMHESGGVPGKRQPNGQGRGLMQVDGGYHPEAYDPRMTGTSASDIQFQIDTGARILSQSLAAAKGNTTLGIQNYAGSAYRGPGGQNFADELRASYFPAVSAALGVGGDSTSGDTGATSGSSGTASDGGFLQGLTDIGATFARVVGFFSDPQNYIRILLGVIGTAFVIGGLLHATGTDSKLVEAGKQTAEVAAVA